jgi:integrase
MNAVWDRRQVDRFVHTMHLRHPGSVKVYTCILQRFHRFVGNHATGEPPSQATIRAWLDARRREWPVSLVHHRARLVDRFLEWLVASGTIPTNPFAEWRRQYGQRTTASIVWALLSPHADAALEALRPLPRYGSAFGELLRAHVAQMQALGYCYQTEAEQLLRFDRFLQGRADLVGAPLPVVIQTWADARAGVHHAWEAHACGRVISTALHRLDPTTPILPVDPDIARQVRQQHRQPYICSADDIRRILLAARTLPSPKAPLRQGSVYLMVVLALCAGLRLGELARLTLADVHLDDGTIEIRGTKFFKSRRLPLAPTVLEALRAYLEARQKAGASMQGSAGLFWHPQRRGRYSRVMIGYLLVQVLRRTGLKPAKGKAGPRVHDLRHAFVVHRMLTWYHEGINPQTRLPYLATYLGHRDINSTLVYLTVTPELLQLASHRFRQHSGGVLGAPGDHP